MSEKVSWTFIRDLADKFNAGHLTRSRVDTLAKNELAQKVVDQIAGGQLEENDLSLLQTIREARLTSEMVEVVIKCDSERFADYVTNEMKALQAELEEVHSSINSTRMSMDEIRHFRAVAFLDIDVHKALNMTAEDYIASIPEVPAHLVEHDERFPHLVFTEPRLGLKKLCKLEGIDFTGNNQTFQTFDDRHTDSTAPRWMRAHDGRRNRNKKPSVCRSKCKAPEFSLTALRGVSLYIQEKGIISRDPFHTLDLPGSVHVAHGGGCARLGIWCGSPELRWGWSDSTPPEYGSGSARE